MLVTARTSRALPGRLRLPLASKSQNAGCVPHTSLTVAKSPCRRQSLSGAQGHNVPASASRPNDSSFLNTRITCSNSSREGKQPSITYLAPQYRYRSLRQRIHCLLISAHGGLYLRTIRASIAVFAVRPPLVFVRAESDAVDRFLEVAISLPIGVGKPDLHAMRALPVLVYQHHRPLPVWSLHNIRCHQHVPERIADIALGPVHAVQFVDRLHPLLIDQLPSEVVRGVALNVEITIYHKHSERAPGIVASPRQSAGDVVKKVISGSSVRK